jgi:hypothetical protein
VIHWVKYKEEFQRSSEKVMNTMVGCNVWSILSKSVAVAMCYCTIGFILFDIEENFLNSGKSDSEFFV